MLPYLVTIVVLMPSRSRRAAKTSRPPTWASRTSERNDEYISSLLHSGRLRAAAFLDENKPKLFNTGTEFRQKDTRLT